MNRSILFSAPLLFSSLFAQTAPATATTIAQTIPAPAAVTVPAAAIIPVTPATTIAQTADVQYNDKREESDMEALRRWLQDKRFVSLKEIGGDLSISGRGAHRSAIFQ
jgi:hypothetical protein